ncbi:MAG: RHS repeat-associated core domain-containing protein [Clostridia bacterium]|nr:RHS repeat-associated core domain-containing protein [Clostridia bacterium]
MVKVLGIAGIVLNTYTYDAFGVITQQSETVGNTFYYAGYQYDSETGLYYLRSRYYNAETARFITEDSFNGYYNDPLSLNRYTYCHNSPIIYFDPDGQAAYNTRMTDTGYSLDSRAMANEIRQEIDKNEDNSFEFPDQLFGLTETTITNISPLHVNDDLIAGGYKVTVGTIDTRGDEGWININTTNIFYTDGTFKTICTLSLGIIDLSVNGGTDGVGISIGGKIDFKEDISYSGHVGLQIDNVGLFLEGAGSSAVRHTYTESTARIGISKEGLKMILAVLAASQCIPAPDPFPTPVPPPFPVPPPIPAPAY